MRSEIDDFQGPVCIRSEDFHSRLYKWKRNNALFGDLMDQFNKCFGLILFFYIASFFICSTFKFFLVLNHWALDHRETAATTLFIILKELIFFTMTIYIPLKIRTEVIFTILVNLYRHSYSYVSFQSLIFTKKLRWLYFEDAALQQQVQHFPLLDLKSHRSNAFFIIPSVNLFLLFAIFFR